MKLTRSLLAAALFAAALPALQGCVPLVATGAGAGVLAIIDRRPLGIQTDDETNEWKLADWVAQKFGKENHVNVTSYNRQVLITGEAVDEDTKARIGELVGKGGKVKGVWNELAVGPASSLTNRSNDAYITSKVKARFVDAGQFSANHVKVVTEAGAVFLMGIVNEREAQAAVNVARTTSGVRKVVNVLEIVPESETRRLDARTSSDNGQSAPKEAPVDTPSAQ